MESMIPVYWACRITFCGVYHFPGHASHTVKQHERWRFNNIWHWVYPLLSNVCKVEEAKVTEKKINEAREHYRPAAARASLLYFILNDLEKINPLYQFSLKVLISLDTRVVPHHWDAWSDCFSVGSCIKLMEKMGSQIPTFRSENLADLKLTRCL